MTYRDILLITIFPALLLVNVGMLVYSSTESPIVRFGFWAIVACIAYSIAQIHITVLKDFSQWKKEKEQTQNDLKKALRYIQGHVSSLLVHFPGLESEVDDSNLDAWVENLNNEELDAQMQKAHEVIRDRIVKKRHAVAAS